MAGFEELCGRWRRTVGFSEPLESFAGDATYRPPEPEEVPPPATGGVGFECLERIGQGGMGDVFRARQTDLRRVVAVKQLRGGKSAGFVLEALTTGHLEHPNIVPVHALVKDPGGRPSLVMKLVEGESWEERLARGEENLVAGVEILLQVCNAVAYAHSRGIVHNDLKPANVMLGAFGEVLLLDWGLAVDVSGREDSALRRPAAIRGPCGTPAYAPPELARGDGAAVGTWTDVYLLGALLYRLLAGRPPHTGQNLLESLVARMDGPDLGLPDAPEELAALCRRALADEPAERPDGATFSAELRAWLRHRESLRLGAAAEAHLAGLAGLEEQGRRHELYGRCGEALAGFRQALALWEDNGAARDGARRARRTWARAALAFGDLGLAESQVEELPADEASPLRASIVAARTRRERERRARRRLGRVLLGGTVLLVALLAAGLWMRESQNRELRLRAELESRAATLRRLDLRLRGYSDSATLAGLQEAVRVEIAGLRTLQAEHPEENALPLLEGRAYRLLHLRDEAGEALDRGLRAADSPWTAQVGLRERALFWRAALGLDRLLAASLSRQNRTRRAELASLRAETLPRLEVDLRGAEASPALGELAAAWRVFLTDGPEAALPLADALAARGGPEPGAHSLAALCCMLASLDTGERVGASLDRDANQPIIWLGRAMLGLNQRLHDVAEESLQRARMLDPDSWAVRQATVSLQIERGALAAAEAGLARLSDSLFITVCRADIALRRGDSDAALALAEEAARLAPDSHDTWYALGEVLRQRGDFPAALEAAEQAVALEPRVPRGLQLRSWLYRQLDRRDAAYRDAERLAREHPRLANGWELLGQMQSEDGDLAAAAENFREALARDPDSPIGLYGEALIAYRQERPEAEALASRVLAVHPDFVDALELRAILRKARGDAVGLRADLDRLIELAPSYDFHYQRHILLMEQGDREGALADLIEMLQTPEGEEVQFPLMYRQGKLLYELGDLESAIATFELCLPIAPTEEDRAMVENALRQLRALR